MALDSLGVLSPDGHCRAFDAAANGMVRGEACACVVLQPLSAAPRAYAVLLGSSSRHAGAGAGALTAPAPAAVAAVIRDAVLDAGVAAGDVGYVEVCGVHASRPKRQRREGGRPGRE